MYVVADNQLALRLLDWFPKKAIIDMCRDMFFNKINDLSKIRFL